MVNTHLNDFLNVVVVKGVVYLLTLAARADELVIAQNAELVRDCALLHSESFRDAENAQLLVGNRVHNAQAS